MRFILACILLTHSYFLFSQNYNVINPTAKTFFIPSNPFTILTDNYMYKTGKFVISLKTDSIITDTNSITYYLYHTLTLKDSFECQYRKDFHWTGKKIIEMNDGTTIVFNNHNDSLFIKTQNGLNSPWVFYKFQNNDYVEAAFTSVLYDTSLSIYDSIKICSLTRKNNLGNIVQDDINNVELKISKHYGITSFFSFRDYPDSIQSYHLCGIQNQNSGIYIPKISEVYGFQPGDELHYIIKTISGIYINNESIYQEIRRILTSTTDNIGDSIVYTYERTRYGCSGITIHDTITKIIYNIDSLANIPSGYSVFDPMEQIPENTHSGLYTLQNELYNSHTTLTLPELVAEKSFIDTTCFSFPMLSKNSNEISNYSKTTFIKGLGILRNEYALADWQSPLYKCFPCEELVYYQTSGEQWGRPVNINNILSDVSSLNIYPNPANESLTIDITNHNIIKITVYSLLGNTVSSQSINNETFATINISNLLSGIYMITVEDNTHQSHNRRFIKN